MLINALVLVEMDVVSTTFMAFQAFGQPLVIPVAILAAEDIGAQMCPWAKMLPMLGVTPTTLQCLGTVAVRKTALLGNEEEKWLWTCINPSPL